MAYNPLTRTTETGGMYAGKDQAERKYSGVLNRGNKGGVYGSANRLAAQKRTVATVAQGNDLENAATNAALTQAESDLQDELAADNRQQAANTASFAQMMASQPQTPGGSIKRGAGTTIGEASGGGLARANAEAKRKARMAAAKAAAGSSSAVLASKAASNLGYNKDQSTLYGLGRLP